MLRWAYSGRSSQLVLSARRPNSSKSGDPVREDGLPDSERQRSLGRPLKHDVMGMEDEKWCNYSIRTTDLRATKD